MKDLREFYQTLNEEELDTLLKSMHKDVLDEETLARIQAQTYARIQFHKKKTVHPVWRRVAILAICVVLLLSAGFGTYLYAMEVRIYKEAVQFFRSYNLSTEGLSRDEIKAVHKDIITKSFSYERTADVIQNSMTKEQIAGFELWQDEPTPQDVENLWNYKNYNGQYWITDTTARRGVYYKNYAEDTISYIEKYNNDELLWQVVIVDYYVTGYDVFSDGVLVYGSDWASSTNGYNRAWISKINPNGQLIWIHCLEPDLKYEDSVAAFEQDDGSFITISRGNLGDYLCWRRCDHTGTVLQFKKNKMDRFGIDQVIQTQEGFLAHIFDVYGTEEKLVRIGQDGSVIELFSYDTDDIRYYIKHMIEFNGKIYLSAYACEKSERLGRDSELAPVLDYLFDRELPYAKISSEELTPLVRNCYTAILLACDLDTGKPETFYSADGSLGGHLRIDAKGNLLWDVESLAYTSFSPYTSAYTIKGSCYIYRYTFGDDGTLLSQTKTGETTSYYR